MVRFLPLLLLLAVPVPAAAQNARALLDSARVLEARDPDGAVQMVRDLIPTLPDSLLTRGLVLRCMLSTEVLPESTATFAGEGLRRTARTGDSIAATALRICRGGGAVTLGEMAKAAPDLEAGLRAARLLGDSALVARALVYRGEAAYYRGDFAGAARDLDQGHRLHLVEGDSVRIRYALAAMANLYADERVGLFDRAIEFYQQLLREHQRLGSQREVAIAYFNLGSTEERKGNLGQALAHYRQALAIDARLDADEAAYDRRAIGVVLYKLNRPGDALALFDQALAHYRARGNDEMVAWTRLSRGVALRMSGRAREAAGELEAARAHFAATGNRRFLEKVHEERALSYAALGQWDSAYAARDEQLALMRALTAESRDEQSARLRTRFDAEHRERENILLQRENALRREELANLGRIRRLQLAVLLLSAVVIAALAILVARQVAGARRLRTLAMTDELTGLANRRQIGMLAGDRVRAARQGGPGFAVVEVDLDRFKEINDRFGHEVGDAVLRRVAQVSRGALRAGDSLARWGGEEFIAILPGADRAAAREVAERMRTAVAAAETRDLHPERSPVTLSAGIAVWEPADASFAQVSRRADDALYRAKNAGRNRVELD